MGLGSFTGGGLGFGLAMHLQDAFSKPARGIEKSLDRLDGKVSRVRASVNKNLKLLGKGALIAGVGAVMLAGFIPAIQRSIELSDKLADVRKTTGFTHKEVKSFQRTLQDLDSRTSLDDLLDIGRIGGQIGVAKKELEGFTKSTDKLVIALGDEFTGGAEQVASEIGGIGKAFGIFDKVGIEQGMLNIGNALNKLGAEGLATAPYLSNFTTRLAASSRTAKAGAGDIIGLGAAFSELKIAPEAASSGVERALSSMGNNLDKFAKAAGINTKEFKKQFETNGITTLVSFAQGLKKNSTSTEDWLKKLKDLRLNGISTSKVIGSMANNTSLFEEKIKSAGLGMKGTGSIMEEFNLKNNTLAARVDKLKKKFDDIKIAMGDISTGPFSWLLSGFDKLIGLIGAFLRTKIGKFVLSLTMALGALAVVIGLVIASVALFKIGLIKMSFAFGKATAASISHAVATGRLKVAFRLMGRSARRAAYSVWAAMAPLLPVILPIVAVVALLGASFWAVNKGMKTFNSTTSEGLSKLKGFKKLLATVGGVFQAIREFWKFFDGENSAITGGTFDRLKALGISDEGIEVIGSYVVRARAMWEGFKEGFIAVWDAMKTVYNSVIKPVFKAIWNTVKKVFSSFGIDLEKLGGSMDTFKTIGMILAGVVMAVVIPMIISLTISMFSLAVGVIAATWPILLIIGVILGLIWVFNNWGKIVDWIKAKWNQFSEWLGGFIDKAKNWGTNLVKNIWEGVKSKWGAFKDWISGAWDKLTRALNPMNWFGSGDEDKEITTTNRVNYNHNMGKAQLAMANTAPHTAMAGFNPNLNVDASTGPTTNAIYLDGELIAKNVQERQEMDNSRSN